MKHCSNFVQILREESVILRELKFEKLAFGNGSVKYKLCHLLFG